MNPDKPCGIKWMTLYSVWEITDEKNNSLGFYKIHRQGELNIDIVENKESKS